jgi:hypothetical protein
VHFVTKISLYFWNLSKILRLSKYGKAGLRKNFFSLFLCTLPKGQDKSDLKIVFACFWYFYIKMNTGVLLFKKFFWTKSTHPIGHQQHFDAPLQKMKTIEENGLTIFSSVIDNHRWLHSILQSLSVSVLIQTFKPLTHKYYFFSSL